MSDPKRLSKTGPSALRFALDDVRRDVPDAAHFDGMARQVASLTGGGGGGPSGPGAPPSPSGAATNAASAITSAKLALVGAAAVATGVTALVLSGLPSGPRHEERVSAPITAKAVAPAATSLTPTAVPAPSAIPDPVDVAADSVATAELPSKAPARSRPAASEQAPSLGDETALVAKAHALLATDPRASLRACDEHKKRYPAGLLVQEREVIAIEARVKSGDTQGARRAAEIFLAQYPSSGHVRRVRDLLGL